MTNITCINVNVNETKDVIVLDNNAINAFIDLINGSYTIDIIKINDEVIINYTIQAQVYGKVMKFDFSCNIAKAPMVIARLIELTMLDENDDFVKVIRQYKKTYKAM